MKNSALSILRTFTEEEIRSFEDFLNSPFHNKNNKVIQLFDALKKFHPDYDDVNLTKENLFNILYGKQKYKESYVRNLFSDLKISSENFFVHNHIRKSKRKTKILIEELHDRDITGLLNKKIEAFENEIKKKKLKDQDYYSDKLFVYEMKSFILVDKTLTDNFRKDQIRSMIKYFLISLMESSFHLIIEEQRVRIKHDFNFLKYILNYITEHLSDFQNVPLLMIYYYLWMSFLDEKSGESFSKARHYFKSNFNSLTQTDKKNIYSVMQLYYDNKIKEGKTEYNKELLKLLLEMLDNNVISHNKKNFIHLNLYRNILILCFKLNEREILKEFISGYLKFVRSESRNSIAAYSKSHLHFLEGDFESVLVCCNKINFSELMISTNENLYFKLDVKTLMIKCFYELDSFESALSHLHAFRQFLNNSAIIKENSRRMYLFFLKSVHELIRLKLNFDEYKNLNLKKSISAFPSATGADWMLDKIKELERKFKKRKFKTQMS